MSDNKECLNCNEKLIGKFCNNCGQKSNTHRITPKYFFLHDIVHGTWHLDKGILFTLKEAIVRPGQAALDYISGKRIRYYNVFYLCLILLGLSLLLGTLTDKEHSFDLNGYELFLLKYAKIFVFGIIPLLALSSKIIFNKMKLNFAEHFIVGGFACLNLILSELIMKLMDNVFHVGLLNAFESLFPILVFSLIIMMVYYNFGKNRYSRVKLFLLTFLMILFNLIMTMICLSVGNFIYQALS